MSKLLTDILESIGENNIKKISNKIGLPDDSIMREMTVNGIGTILGGLSKNSQDKKESQKIIDILKKDHLNNLENVDDIVSGSIDKKGKKILEHSLKGKKEKVISTFSKKFKIDKNKAGGFLELLAPLVMGSLAKTTDKTKMNSEILSQILKMATDSDLENNKSISGFLKILDLNKNGKIMDDLPKIFAGIMAGLKFLGFVKKK